MGQLGFSEMLVIFIVALLVFGPKKLPELGKSLGKGIREFRKATDELKSTWEEQVKDIHNMGQDLKTDFYNSLEAEGNPQPTQAAQTAPALAAPAAENHETSHPTETTVPKEHV